jgi:molybdopterin-containing oxidoreductase family membrane subunit
MKMNDLARNQIRDELMPRRFGKLGKLWTIVLIMIVLLGSYFYVQQIRNGLGVTGLGNYHTWGVYISNFVFFVAISLVGSLISAILKLSNVKWQTPLTRISEMIAVAAIIFAAIVIIIDMGRPDRFMNVVLKARIQSPITWDVIVISTYFVISIILLYLPLVPDLALMRDKGTKERPWVQKMYRLLAINWKGSDEQKKILNSSIRVLSILIIPVAFGIHTVTSWLFATTFRPGWDSTNFGPYFVSGAFMVGAAAVICAMYLVRRQYGLEKYFSNDLFNKMGRLLVLLSLVYFYFNINEYLTPAYKMKAKEMGHLQALFTGEYATMFWSTQVLGMLVPIIVLVFRRGRRPVPMFIISIMVIVGAWFKRFLIVVPTLSHPLITTEMLPDSALHYVPTFAELSITAATLAGALLILTILIRYFPVVPIVETLEEKES